jgi:hypothetical protein
MYTLDGRQLSLSINEATIQTPEDSAIPVVLFGSNFSYDVTQANGQQKIPLLTAAIDNCLVDFKLYNDLVNQRFLGMEDTNHLPSVITPEKIG